jgi:Na+/phosphate symporter
MTDQEHAAKVRKLASDLSQAMSSAVDSGLALTVLITSNSAVIGNSICLISGGFKEIGIEISVAICRTNHL